MGKRAQWVTVEGERGIQASWDGRYRVRVTRPRDAIETLPEGATLEDARRARVALQSRLEAELSASTRPAPDTVAAYAETWMGRRRATCSSGTASTYAIQLELHILPHLGDVSVHEVNRGHVEAWVAWAQEVDRDDGEPYSRATVMGWWSTLKQILADMAADYDRPDPCRRVRPPRRAKAAKRSTATLTGEELARLIDAAEELAPERHLEVAVLALTGLRLAELHRLRWSDVSVDRRTIRVREGKTDAAARDIVIPHGLAHLLRSHRRAALEGGSESGLVFPPFEHDRRRPETRSGAALAKRIVELGRALGLAVRVTPQVLRRTYNTLLVAEGIDRIALRGQVGHTDEQMTQHYADTTRGALHARKLEAADAIERLVWGGEG